MTSDIGFRSDTAARVVSVVSVVSVDSVDRKLLNALAVEPRASFQRMAAVIGVSDQTVGRRYRRLRRHAGLRVQGRLHAGGGGLADWYLRVGCVPGAATVLAAALAARRDTSWVVLVSGGTEIVCGLQVRNESQRDALLLDGLPGSRRVAHLGAQSLLHDYSAGPWRQLTGHLTPAECELLEPVPVVAEPDGRVSGDELRLGELLMRDGRAATAGLAAALGWHESSVRRRIQDLRRTGRLRFRLDLDARSLSLNVHALLWASVEPGMLDRAGSVMSAQPEVPFVAATTGAANLMAAVYCRDATALHAYLNGPFASLPGIRSVEVAPIIRVVKRGGPPDG